uniref:Ankyrin repeat protein nuc-2 n=2 Tax=Anthurium amnicola TaxID=1678845 RepID=A0A1D1Y9G4_9ARAE
MARILKPQGFLAVHTPSAGDPYSLSSFLAIFPGLRLVGNREIDGLDSSATRELVLQKQEANSILALRKKQWEKTGSPGGSSKNKCPIPDHKLKLLQSAEPLIEEEPLKPWITFKRNVQNIKYLPSMADISFKSRYVYVDVGARSYGSSIVSWFKKQYPKQNKTFDVYAIEADRTFHAEYALKKGVTLLPYAAWVRNETLSFEINEDPDQKDVVKGRGMGRIQPAGAAEGLLDTGDVDKIQGFDFAEWLKSTASKTDFVVMKMDVEGTEFDLIPRLFDTGAICLIDELFLECHYNRWQRCCPGKRSPKYQNTYGQCLKLFSLLRESGVLVHQWW